MCLDASSQIFLIILRFISKYIYPFFLHFLMVLSHPFLTTTFLFQFFDILRVHFLNSDLFAYILLFFMNYFRFLYCLHFYLIILKLSPTMTIFIKSLMFPSLYFLCEHHLLLFFQILFYFIPP